MKLLATLLLLALPAAAQQQTIRAWGDDAFAPTLNALEHAFRTHHPNITFADKLTGTGTAMAGIITGVSDISIMGRPTDTNENIGFEWVHRTKPYGVQIAAGPLQGEGHSPALTVFVSPTNPLRNISIAQLAAIITCHPDAAAPTWSAAGVTGAFASHPIHVYIYDITSGTGAFLQQAITPDSDCWNWDVVREFRDTTRNNRPSPAAAQIAEALRRDPDGLGFSTLQYASSSARPLAINGISPTAATLSNGTYPLARPIFIYIERKPNTPIEPTVRTFLRFILSPEGQHIIASTGDFLPLDSAAITAQLHKLD